MRTDVLGGRRLRRPNSPRGPIERGRTLGTGPKGVKECAGLRTLAPQNKNPELLRHATIGPRSWKRWGQTLIAPSVLEAMALLEGRTPITRRRGYLGISLHVRIPHANFHVKQSTIQCVRRG